MDRWRASKAPTHMCMNGGMLKVPDSEMEEFFARYVETVTTGRLYLVEKITPKFRFFLDLDWTGNAPNLPALAETLTKAIGSPPLLAATPPKPKDGGTKYGIHAHWTDVIVDRSEALELRERLPAEIKRYADASVYSTGLRMLWSYKKDGSLPYVPLDEHFKPAPAPDVRALRRFSIKAKGVASQVPAESDSLLLEFVRKYLPGQANANFKKRTKQRIESDSRYCERIGREHRSNHVYFVVDPHRRTVHQGCFDDECKDFAGKRYLLSPSVLNEVAAWTHVTRNPMDPD